MQRARYCVVESCPNRSGSRDKNVPFFRSVTTVDASEIFDCKLY